MPTIEIVVHSNQCHTDRQLIRLWGGTAADEFPTLLLALAKENQVETPSSLATVTGRLIEAESLIISGGLRIRDGELCILPGCCCGIEDWRDQVAALVGSGGWLGHDPAPWAEHTDQTVRVWSDGGLDRAPNSYFIDLSPLMVGELEDATAKDLAAFLCAFERWGGCALGDKLTRQFVAKLDSAWQISEKCWAHNS
jgi:hypothetical protein